MSQIPFAPVDFGAIAQGLSGGPSSTVDTGFKDNRSINIVGNVGANIGEILRNLESYPVQWGGYGVRTPSAIENLGGLSPVSVGNVSNDSGGFGIGGILGIGLLAAGAFVFLRRN